MSNNNNDGGDDQRRQFLSWLVAIGRPVRNFPLYKENLSLA